MLAGPTSAAEAAADFSSLRLVTSRSFLGPERCSTLFCMVQSSPNSIARDLGILFDLISPWPRQLASSAG
jgi:hypothetical protein